MHRKILGIRVSSGLIFETQWTINFEMISTKNMELILKKKP